MKTKKWKILIIGLLSGVISGFFGAGGGLVLVPYMTKILKEDEVTARATTIMCIFFMVLASSIFYFYKSVIDWSLAGKCIIGGIIGSFIGSKWLIKLNSKWLEITFIIFLFYSGFSFLLK